MFGVKLAELAKYGGQFNSTTLNKSLRALGYTKLII